MGFGSGGSDFRPRAVLPCTAGFAGGRGGGRELRRDRHRLPAQSVHRLCLRILASDAIIIPVLSDVCSTVGVSGLVEQIDDLRSIQPTLRVAGVLFNQWHRAPVVDDAMTTLREECPVPIFDTVIRRTDKVPESSWAGRAVQAWSPWCSAARDYRAWVAELLEKEGMFHE